jgi:hypothetical protein
MTRSTRPIFPHAHKGPLTVQDRIDGAIPLHNVYDEPAFYVPVADDHLRAAQTADKIAFLWNHPGRGLGA